MTKNETNWILYDVANSAFMMIIATIIPIYFKNIAAAEGVSPALSTSYWGYAISFSTFIMFFISPVLGTMGDFKGYKKLFFMFFVALGALGCFVLAVPMYWYMFLLVFVVARIGHAGSLVFYDGMLSDVTTESRMDLVSSYGYAFGYIGSCVPFIACLALILTAEQTGIGTTNATLISFVINAIWWLAFTLPLLRTYKQTHCLEMVKNPIKSSFTRLFATLRDVKGNKHIFTFLIAFFLYIDGVYTIIEMATSYGKDVGVSDNDLLLALLVTQIVAFPFAIIFGKISKKFSSVSLIKVCIIGYFGIAIFALQLDSAAEFWFLAICVAIFQGGVQSLSRSHFAKLIPKERASEYFGLYDIFGKGAVFTGALLMGVVTQVFGHSRYGVFVIVIMFMLGYIMFGYHEKVKNQVTNPKY